MKNFFAPLKTKFCDRATFKKTAGILLLAIGFVALFLPFVPGILFGILGLELLGMDARIRKKVVDFFRPAKGGAGKTNLPPKADTFAFWAKVVHFFTKRRSRSKSS